MKIPQLNKDKGDYCLLCKHLNMFPLECIDKELRLTSRKNYSLP
jgi:hypothetical protein